MTIAVFATSPYAAMQARLCALPGFRPGQLDRQVFPDGERGLRITEDVKDKDVLLLGGTFDDHATLELYDLACGLVSLGVNTLSLVVPYFGYSTQERASLPGEVVTAKARALMLSSIPTAVRANEIVLIDLHTPGIAFYFEGHIHGFHLSAQELVLGVVRGIASKHPGETVIACTDAGRAKSVQGLANDSGIPAAFVYKSRQPNGRLAVTGVNADVKGKHVIIYDDIVRTGGSLIQAGEAFKKAGAATITAVATHGVLPKDSLERIKGQKLFEHLHITDSLPHAERLAAQDPGFVKVMPLAPLIARHFRTS